MRVQDNGTTIRTMAKGLPPTQWPYPGPGGGGPIHAGILDGVGPSTNGHGRVSCRANRGASGTSDIGAIRPAGRPGAPAGPGHPAVLAAHRMHGHRHPGRLVLRGADVPAPGYAVK